MSLELIWAPYVPSESLLMISARIDENILTCLQRAIAGFAFRTVQLDRTLQQDSRQLCPQPSFPGWLSLPPIPEDICCPVFLRLPDHLACLVPRQRYRWGRWGATGSSKFLQRQEQ